MQPKVSIIIPSYNHKKYILETLRSIQNQTYKNIQTIVVDDGSTDGSAEYLKSVQNDYKFELLVKKNEGLCRTINKGLELATGEYIIIIASDDSMPSVRIADQVATFEGQNFDVISGGMTLIDEESKELKYISPLKLGMIMFSDMLTKSVIYAPTAMYKNTTFKKFGKYNPDHVIEDYSMWLNILSKGGNIVNFDKNWAYYRVNQVVTRSKIDWYYKGLMQVISQYWDDPIVWDAFIKRRFQYLIKVSILDGVKGFNEAIERDREEISWMQLISLYALALLPRFIRSFLKRRINRN